uniref:Uncharacterized protein n=1 Tax=Pararge aegeria TaxID=116150 RepID=S4PWH8_9NEOP
MLVCLYLIYALTNKTIDWIFSIAFIPIKQTVLTGFVKNCNKRALKSGKQIVSNIYNISLYSTPLIPFAYYSMVL